MYICFAVVVDVVVQLVAMTCGHPGTISVDDVF